MSENRTAGTGPDTTTDDVPDEIVRSIRIDAEAQTVWGIISEPGWFINDGEWAEHEITTEGDVSRVVDPVHGEFSIRTVELDPPRRAVFRWLGGQVGSVDEFPSNTIEFTVEPQGSGVVLTVRETGFAGLSSDAVVRGQRFEENSAGWATELDLARRRAEDQA
ncbi:SRPBCC domain-containing protein [Dietzia sp. 111N12-1]|uniref:SRPBCC domain-containing protein n=1 Tax=Dietzia sp. 111N12-1 TaxID=1785156 RepID=UPI000804C181|nr:SRPBCC domain-containing protein [Dietzia sp. 111N12-1]OAV76384.1 polyketide cyclase [Dietzia sp. 111N12-1]